MRACTYTYFTEQQPVPTKSVSKSDMSVRNKNHLTATGNTMPYGITQCGDFPAFTPAEAGTQFSDRRLERYEAELTWVVVIFEEFSCEIW